MLEKMPVGLSDWHLSVKAFSMSYCSLALILNFARNFRKKFALWAKIWLDPAHKFQNI